MLEFYSIGLILHSGEPGALRNSGSKVLERTKDANLVIQYKDLDLDKEIGRGSKSNASLESNL